MENEPRRARKSKLFQTFLGGLGASAFFVFIALATGDMSGLIKLAVAGFILGAIGGFAFATVEFLPPRRNSTRNKIPNLHGEQDPPEVIF